MTPTVRFAPSPTGVLHLGNARTAVVNWLFARQDGGRFILRIDDTDRARSEERFIEAIRQDLRWLGLVWDEEHRQSLRAQVHEAAFERLRAAGRVYPCFETAEELEAKREAQRAKGRPPRYDRWALTLGDADRARLEAEGRRPHWRFRLGDGPAAFTDLVKGPRSIDLQSLSDPVLRREDGGATYLFASVVDDAAMGITDVIRGEDHLANTAVQLELIGALGERAPAFAHLPLVLDAAGGKVSKRAGAASLAELRDRGIEPLAILQLLATLGTGQPADPAASLDDLVARFSLSSFGQAQPHLDPGDLDRLSAEVVHRLPFEAVRDRLEAIGIPAPDAAFWEAVRGNLARVAEALDWWRITKEPLEPKIVDEALLASAAVLMLDRLESPEDAEAWLDDVKEVTGRRGKALDQPLRLALTGREHGPEMKLLLPLIGRERARRRLLGETA
jgi:glutamyl-tRNA synthetase